MPLAPKFNKFTTVSPVLTNFSFTDVISGAGYIEFFGSRGFHATNLSTATSYSGFIETYQSTISDSTLWAYQAVVERRDYKTLFQKPATIKGENITNATMIVRNPSSSSYQVWGQLKVMLKKFTGNAEVTATETQTQTWISPGTTGSFHGVKITANSNCKINSVTRVAGVTGAYAIVMNADRDLILGYGAFSGNIATLNVPAILDSGSTYYILIGSTSTFTYYSDASPSFPQDTGLITWTGGANIGADTVDVYNVASVETETMTEEETIASVTGDQFTVTYTGGGSDTNWQIEPYQFILDAPQTQINKGEYLSLTIEAIGRNAGIVLNLGWANDPKNRTSGGDVDYGTDPSILSTTVPFELPL